MLSIILSILFPGLGQIYLGRTSSGLTMLLLSLIPFLYPFVLIYSIFDVILLKRKGLAPKYTKDQAIKGVFIIFGLLVFAGAIFSFVSIRLATYYSESHIKSQSSKDEGTKIVKSIKATPSGKRRLTVSEILDN